jgi:hypothetical protein
VPLESNQRDSFFHTKRQSVGRQHGTDGFSSHSRGCCGYRVCAVLTYACEQTSTHCTARVRSVGAPPTSTSLLQFHGCLMRSNISFSKYCIDAGRWQSSRPRKQNEGAIAHRWIALSYNVLTRHVSVSIDDHASQTAAHICINSKHMQSSLTCPSSRGSTKQALRFSFSSSFEPVLTVHFTGGAFMPMTPRAIYTSNPRKQSGSNAA